jgi:hypothetical protein
VALGAATDVRAHVIEAELELAGRLLSGPRAGG